MNRLIGAVTVLTLCLVMLLSAGARAEDDAAFKARLAEVLKQNPELILDVLREHSPELLELVEQGARMRRDQQKTMQLQADLMNPKKPAIDKDRIFEGAKDGKIVIVEYTDFLCPYCARASQTMTQLLNKYPDKVKLYFKHQPLHDFSQELAVTFEGVAMQDPAKAWKFRDMVFARQADFTDAEKRKAALNEVVDALKIDKQRLKKDVQDPAIEKRIQADLSEAQGFGLRGTPMFLINGVAVRGAQPLPDFEAVIKAVEDSGLKAN